MYLNIWASIDKNKQVKASMELASKEQYAQEPKQDQKLD